MKRATGANPAVRLGKRRILSWLHLLIIAISLAGCSDPIEVARTLPDAPSLTLREEWRLEGRTQLLGPIAWVVVGPAGEIFVGHDPEARIMAFDSTGERRGILGGKGREPGNFENLMRGGTISDTLWVYDGLLRRVTLFTPDLRYARQFGWPPAYDERTLSATRDASLPNLLGITPAGSVISSVYRERLSRTAADSLTVPWDPDGRFVPEGRQLLASDDVPQNATYGDGIRIDNIRLFPVDPVFAAASDGTAFVHVEAFVEGSQAGTFQVVRFDAEGDTTFIRRHSFYPVQIPAAVAESAVEQGVRRLRASPRATPRAIEAYRKAVWIPPVYPPILSVLAGRDGSTWIRMRPLVEDNSEYLVLDSEGNLAGQLSIGGNVEILAAERERVWAVTTDSLGVESLAVFAVEGFADPTNRE